MRGSRELNIGEPHRVDALESGTIELDLELRQLTIEGGCDLTLQKPISLSPQIERADADHCDKQQHQESQRFQDTLQ